jgi:hypothetical protein
VRETAVRVDHALAVPGHQPGGVGAGGGGRDLLAEHGAQGELLRVRGPGHPAAGCGGDEGREHGVLGQAGVHR